MKLLKRIVINIFISLLLVTAIFLAMPEDADAHVAPVWHSYYSHSHTNTHGAYQSSWFPRTNWYSNSSWANNTNYRQYNQNTRHYHRINNSHGYSSRYSHSHTYTHNHSHGNNDYNHSNDQDPDATTFSATNVDENEATLRGSIDMNDFDDGRVFFVYGEDEDQIEDIERDYDSYSDVDEDGNDLQKELLVSNFDGRRNFSEEISGLDDDTDHYFRICVEFEDEDNDDTLECGSVREFETDRD